MRIFIDEAGIFVDPNQTNQHKVSVLGGLVIPDYSYDAVIKFYNAKKTEWGVHGEVKGSKLNESQVDSLVRGLESYNVLFDAVVVDTKFTTSTSITKHKSGFSQYLLQIISPYHHDDVVRQIKALSCDVERFSDQDYIQNIAKASLFKSIHEIATLFYVQRRPTELARFKWVIDAKDLQITKAEK